MSEQQHPEQTYSEKDALGAIRLAMEAGADPGVRSKVIGEILRRAPLTDPANVSSVNLLIRAVQAAKAEFRVTDHEPKGRLARI